MGFVHQFFILMTALTWFFIFCINGNELNNAYEDVNSALYNCSYALLNLGLGKHLPFIMHNTQRPVRMRALMNVECMGETFKKVKLSLVENLVI